MPVYICISGRVVGMDLMILIKNEDNAALEHKIVKTRASSTLLESLCNVLEQPVEYRYRLLDPGVTWSKSLAKQFKASKHTCMY